MIKMKEGDSMGYSPAQKRAILKYQKRQDSITIRIPKGDRERYKEMAKAKGMSLRAFILSALEEYGSPFLIK